MIQETALSLAEWIGLAALLVTVIGVESEVDQYKARIAGLLQSDAISDEVKALVQAGDIDGAEALVDQQKARRTDNKQRMAAAEYEYGEVKQLKCKRDGVRSLNQ